MRWQGEATVMLNTLGWGLNENRNLLVFISFFFSHFFFLNSDNLYLCLLAFMQNLGNDEPKDDAPGTETFTHVTPSMQQ